MRRKKVLVVDDQESIVLALLHVLYQDNDKYDVLLAKTGEIGQQILRGNEIDVMVTDVRLPGMSGLDLLCWASTESPHTRVIVITAFDTAGLEVQAYRFGCLKIVQKPFDLKKMREIILATIDNENNFAGNLADLSPADVLQMLCLARKTTALRVVDGKDCGVVHIENGEVRHAVWNDMVGEDAFYRLVWARGTFRTLPIPEGASKTIDLNWQSLLIEAMRLRDELHAKPSDREEEDEVEKEEDTPDMGYAQGEEAKEESEDRSGPQPSSSGRDGWMTAVERINKGGNVATTVANLLDQGFISLKAGDLAKARQCWEEARELDPTNRVIELNLRKLEKLENK